MLTFEGIRLAVEKALEGRKVFYAQFLEFEIGLRADQDNGLVRISMRTDYVGYIEHIDNGNAMNQALEEAVNALGDGKNITLGWQRAYDGHWNEWYRIIKVFSVKDEVKAIKINDEKTLFLYQASATQRAAMLRKEKERELSRNQAW